MVYNLTTKGRKLVVIIDPHIKRDSNYFLHNDAENNGYYVKNKDRKDYEGKQKFLNLRNLLWLRKYLLLKIVSKLLRQHSYPLVRIRWSICFGLYALATNKTAQDKFKLLMIEDTVEKFEDQEKLF